VLDEDEPPLYVSAPENERIKDQRRQNDAVPEPQTDMIAAILTLMREEQARARRLERRLSAREREYNARKPSSSAHLDDKFVIYEKRMDSKSRHEAKEKHKKSKDSLQAPNGQEDIESMGQKFMAFLNARSDAQTESG